MTIRITRTIAALLIFIILLLSSFAPSVFAHNSSTISIPVAKKPMLLDGLLNNTEWDDAFKFNFTSPRVHEGYVILYLKYELFDNALSAAFYIPDKTPFVNQSSPDQISFNFDTLHTASKTIDSDDHFIVFVRDGHAEYYRGGATQTSPKGKFISIANSTTNTLKLNNPFSRLDFKTLSNSNAWQGEFKIYFSVKDVERYGFAIQQTDSYEKSGKINYFFINYPIANLTRADSPSTWGDITFFGISQYANNIKKFCSERPSISTNNVAILCIKSVQPSSMEEKTSDDVVVQGNLGNLINGTGVKNQIISTYVVNSQGKAVSSANNEPTDPDGTFLSTIKNVKLTADDTYSIFVKPVSGSYSGLNSTSELIVSKHSLTLEEIVPILGAFFGVISAGFAAFAFIPRIKRHIDHKKEREIIYKCINEINDIYHNYSSNINVNQVIKNLEDKRSSILEMFRKGEVSEEHFKLLDNKISEYEQKLLND